MTEKPSSVIIFSNVISLIALAISMLALTINLFRFFEDRVTPEVFWIAGDVKISLDEHGMTTTVPVTFSVSNRSTRTIHMASCTFHTEAGFWGGGGGYADSVALCDPDWDFSSGSNVSIEPGQTEFFEANYSDLTPLIHIEDSLQIRGFDEGFLQELKAEKICEMKITVLPNGGSMYQSCSISESSLFKLVLTTGHGRSVEKIVKATSLPDWPWARSAGYPTK